MVGARDAQQQRLDLERKVFAKSTPGEIARSLKRSAERSSKAKIDALSFRHVDAGVLYQPGRQEPLGEPAAGAGTCQGRAEKGVRPREV